MTSASFRQSYSAKSLFLIFFSAIFLFFISFIIEVSRGEAAIVPIPDVCSDNLLQTQNDVTCYSDGGATPTCGVHAECCTPLIGCIPEIAACTISMPTTNAWFDTNESLGLNYVANCTDSIVPSFIACLRDIVGKCPSGYSALIYDGYNCDIYKQKDVDNIFHPSTVGGHSGKWSANQEKCVTCSGAYEDKRCGASKGSFSLDASGNCNGAGDGNLESACDADTACDEKSNGNACLVGSACESRGDTCVAGDTCDAFGLCQAAACPPGDFTCQNECAPVNNHQCVGAQLQECITTCDADPFLDWCNAAAESEAGNCADKYDNDCDGLTDYADTIDCPTVTCVTWIGRPVYKKGQVINMFYGGVTCGTGTLELTDPPIPAPAASKKFSVPPPACAPITNSGFMAYNILAADEVGTWTVTLDNAADIGGNPCATVTATTEVVECFNDSDCTDPLKPVCNASGVCIAAVGPGPGGYRSYKDGGAYKALNCSPFGVDDCSTLPGCAVPAPPNPICWNPIFCDADANPATANANACCNNVGSCATDLISCNCGGGVCLVDGIQNNGETGVDCGGGGCPTCCGNGVIDPAAGEMCDISGDIGCVAPTPACQAGCGACVAAVPIPLRCDPDAWFFCNPLKGTVDNLVQAGETLLGYILGLIGSIALLVIIIAGTMYMTSAGSEEKIATSKRILTGAVIGLIIALLAYSLLQIIISIL